MRRRVGQCSPVRTELADGPKHEPAEGKAEIESEAEGRENAGGAGGGKNVREREREFSGAARLIQFRERYRPMSRDELYGGMRCCSPPDPLYAPVSPLDPPSIRSRAR